MSTSPGLIQRPQPQRTNMARLMITRRNTCMTNWTRADEAHFALIVDIHLFTLFCVVGEDIEVALNVRGSFGQTSTGAASWWSSEAGVCGRF